MNEFVAHGPPRLLARLDGEELGLGVTDLAEALGLSETAASHHPAILRAGGLVEGRRDGRRRLYCLSDAARGCCR